VLLVCTVYSELYSEIALSRKPFGIGHMYIYTFFAQNGRYCGLPEYLPFLLGHSVCEHWLILFTSSLKMEAKYTSETSATLLTSARRKSARVQLHNYIAHCCTELVMWLLSNLYRLTSEGLRKLTAFTLLNETFSKELSPDGTEVASMTNRRQLKSVIHILNLTISRRHESRCNINVI
jgi:hypothetical protein